MKKHILIVLLIVFMFFSVCGANENESTEFSLPFNINKGVYVSHYVSGSVSEYEILPSQSEKLAEWAASLKVERREFKSGETPSDADGGEAYSFRAENSSFSYVMCGGKENYILENGEWYYVNNPSDPSKAVKMEGIKYDLIQMVMINGEIYIDTGKESTIMSRCGVMYGEITSYADG